MDIQNITRKYNNSIGRAIVKRNIPHFRLVDKTSIIQVGLGHKQRRFLYDDINSAVSTKICGNKTYTKYFLTQCGVPVPRGGKVHNKEELKEQFDELDKPVVIKPISEMWGKGISTGIQTWEEAEKAYEIASGFKGDYVIMEEHVEGDDHRILFIDGKFVGAMRRRPPFVVGDGKSTIQELIDVENKKRKDSDKIVKEIIVDDTVKNFLEKKDLSLESVLPEGEETKIRMTGNICSGGISENITHEVHPSIIELCGEVISYLDLEIGGVDVLTTDITKPLEESGGKVSEVNQNPDIDMHTAPYIGEPIDTSGMFVDYLFPKTNDAWIKVKKDGKRIETQEGLNDCLEEIPKKVIQFRGRNEKKKSKIKNPDKPLLNYLLSNLTISVEL
jgi:cyanophycin synthetase